jgi:tryptophan-rich sensory protein
MGKTAKLILSIVVSLGVGFIGSFFTSPAIPTWYAGLIKPSFSPPNYLFAPVWTILYILMGISFYLVWQKGLKNEKVRVALTVFAAQFLLNAIWSPIFFGAKNLFWALIVIIFMWIYIVKTILAFRKVSKTASYLLYPYLAWVSFATMLNFSVWFLNK